MEQDEHFEPAGFLGGPPPPANLVGWLKLNLAMTMFVVSLASGIGGALVTATWRIAMAGRTLEDLSRLITQQGEQLAGLHRDMVDVDRRFNDDAGRLNETRRQRDAEVAAMKEQIAVLKAQMVFFGDRVGTPKQIGSR